MNYFKTTFSDFKTKRSTQTIPLDQVENSCRKVLENRSLVIKVPCRNSFDRKLVHDLAESLGLVHVSVSQPHVQKVPSHFENFEYKILEESVVMYESVSLGMHKSDLRHQLQYQREKGRAKAVQVSHPRPWSKLGKLKSAIPIHVSTSILDIILQFSNE